MALKRFVFHLGPHKTGTTFQQNTIRGSLTRGLGMKDGLEFHNEGKIVAYIVAGQPKLQDIWKPFRQDVLSDYNESTCEDLARKLSSMILDFQDYENVALINENLIGPQLGQVTPDLYPGIGNAARFWNRVREMLADNGVDMSLYASFRKQAGFVESTYVNVVRDGKNVDWDEYWDFIDHDKLHWSDFYSRIFDNFPQDFTRVVPFELVMQDSQEFVDTYTHLVDPDFNATNQAKDRREGFSELALKTSLDAFEYINTAKERSHVANALIDLLPKSTYGKPKLMSKEQKAEMTEMYLADNRQVFKNFVDEKYFPLFRKHYKA